MHQASLVRQMGRTLGAPRASETHFGVIVSVQTGPPKSLTLTIDGSSTSVPGVRYLDSLVSPAASDHVLVELIGSDSRHRQVWVVTGRLA